MTTLTAHVPVLDLVTTPYPEDEATTYFVRWNPHYGAGGRPWLAAYEALRSVGARWNGTRWSHEFVYVCAEDDDGRWAQILGDDRCGYVVEISGGIYTGTTFAAVRPGQTAYSHVQFPDHLTEWRPSPVPSGQLWTHGEAVGIAVLWLRYGERNVKLTLAPRDGYRIG